MDYPESLDLYRRAVIIPGRSLTRSKAPGRIGPVDGMPLYASGGLGPHLFDVDGHAYTDMLCALGAVSLGYADLNPSPSGVYSLPHEAEVFAAEKMLQIVPWATRVRFTKTGSEATHAAYRIAKRATGRKRVMALEGAYHGWHEWCDEVERIPQGAPIHTWLRDDIAAVFIEPPRWVPVDVPWLRQVRAACEEVGALFVFDSMIYGGRFALGGASEYFGIVPDMECFGKAIGNGQAVACVVGTDALEAHGEMVSGTYAGDVVGLLAVMEIISIYQRDAVIDWLWARGRQLWEGLTAAGIPLEGAPVHLRIRFTTPEQGQRFAVEMANRGVLWHPAVTNIMQAHSERIIAQVITAAIESWQAVQ